MFNSPIAHPFDPQKFSSAPEVACLADPLVALVRSSYRRVPRSDAVDYAVRCVCLNLFNARVAHPDACVFYPRSPEDYDGWAVSYRVLKRVVDALCEAGYLESVLGEWRGDRRGIRSRMRALAPLLTLFKDHNIRPSMVQTTRLERPIVLRGADNIVDPGFGTVS